MGENKKKGAELAAKNLAQLQKIDIAAAKILDKVEDVVDKLKCIFSFLIANRNDPSDFIEPLTMNHVIKQDGNYIMFQRDTMGIQSLWFHSLDDSTRAAKMLQKLVDKLKSSTTEQAKEAAATKTSAAVPTTAPTSAANIQKPVDLLQMIKTAKQSSSAQQQQGSTNQQSSAPPPQFLTNLIAPNQDKQAKQEPSSSAEAMPSMPVLLQKLMVQEHPRSMLKEPGTAMSADELEKDLLKTAKPRHHLLQEFANSPSAISLAAISTKSVHGSEGDGEADVAEGEVLEPLETSFIVGSGTNTPSLSKEQFLSAITHLMATDDEFVSQIHQAYIDALNRRLNL